MKSRETLLTLIVLSFLFSCKTITIVDPGWYGYNEKCSAINSQVLFWPKEHKLSSRGIGYYDALPVYNGYLMRSNGDTLKGYIKFFRDLIHVLPCGEKTYNDIVRIHDYNEYRSFRIFPDSTNQNCYLDFLSLPMYKSLMKNRIYWRVLGTKGNFMILDDFTFALDGVPSPIKRAFVHHTLLIDKNTDQVYQYHSFLDFINNRYNEHFKKDHFKSEREMIDYILDKENEGTKSY